MSERLPERVRTSVYGIVTKGWEGTRFFTVGGMCHRISRIVPNRPISFVEGLAARLVFNRWLMATIEYDAGERYDFEALRRLLVAAVKDDDDILTQWREKTELLAMLEKARTFAHLVGTLRFAGVDVETGATSTG